MSNSIYINNRWVCQSAQDRGEHGGGSVLKWMSKEEWQYLYIGCGIWTQVMKSNNKLSSLIKKLILDQVRLVGCSVWLTAVYMVDLQCELNKALW